MPLDVEFVQIDVRNLRWRGPIVDTVVMNPLFGTGKKGADMDFLFATLKVKLNPSLAVAWLCLGTDNQPEIAEESIKHAKETRNATGLVAPAIVAGLGALTHTLGTLVPVIEASGFAASATTTVIGTVVSSFR
ncbi:hypothetical protein HYC85_004286 [Camellia sinensis]|uniref:Uncharacterized protein n=1 Tax=Camellia sinensis TaxID=4442 RepID=A0A7J7HXU3_CAMSI|nr:hypothetical protein HYC85_004286 [Camellia sinensis]